MIGIYKDNIQEVLLSKLGFVKLDIQNNEIITRCPWCEKIEVVKRKNRAHLYISMTSPVFKCHRCNKSGIVVKLFNGLNTKLEEIVNDKNCIINITSNKIYDTESLSYTAAKSKLEIPNIDLDTINKYTQKVKYLENRFNTTDLDLSKIPGLVLNISDFLLNNNIKLNDYDVYKLKDYDEQFIGFISYYKSILLLRNINIGNKVRYRKIKLNCVQNIWKDFYGFFNSEIKLDKENTICLSEGPFDILLPLYTKLEMLQNKSILFYAAVMSNDYKEAIYSILNESMITHCNLIILSDVDIPDYRYKVIKNLSCINNLEVYKNSCSKDFGVSTISPVKVTINNFKYRSFKKV